MLRLAAENGIEKTGTDGKLLYGGTPNGRDEAAVAVVVVAVVGIVGNWWGILRERF